MNYSNIIKMDAKGRLLIPFHIRQHIGLDKNSEMLIINNGKKELKILPLLEGRSAEIRLLISDEKGSLAKTINAIAEHNIDILMSQSKTLEKGESAEWSALVDTSDCESLEEMKKRLKSLGFVKNIEIFER